MSPRKTILRELNRSYERHGAESLTRPTDIEGFNDRPADYQKAVNQLLQDRLIQGRPDEDGKLRIGINDHRVQDVRKELRPVWLRPGVWAVFAAMVVALAAFAV